MQSKDTKVAYLLNMISEDGKYSRSHGISSNLLKLQADAIGIPIVQRKTTWEDYENEFKKVVLEFKKESNIKAGVFGDIDLQEHRDWVERVCKKLKIKPILPLWKKEREELLKEFVQVGFKAIVVATDAQFLDKEWLGCQINKKFIEELKTLGNIDLCGEKGEYHSFVYDGPIFKKPVEFTIGEKIAEDRHWFLELKVNPVRDIGSAGDSKISNRVKKQ
jgi:uncharacterized protein (TIGR00290 family)